jgi:hypothetical protein
VSIKNRSLLVPLIILNACLIFSWPNKVTFNREASRTIRARIYTGASIGADGGYDRGAKSEPKGRRGLIAGSRTIPGYYDLSLSRDVYLNGVIVICSSLDR